MAKQAVVSVGLDISSLKKSLGDALGQLNKLTGTKPNVKVKVDDSEINSAEKKIDSLSGTKTVKVNVDASGADKAASGLTSKLGGIGSLVSGAAGGLAVGAISNIAHGLTEGAKAADDFGDKLEVAFTQQGVQDIDAEIEKVNKSTLELANNLGLPAARTKELAGTVATLGGFTGKSAEDLTKLSAGLEVFTDGAVKGEAVAKAFARGINDPEGAAAIESLTKKYPQLANVLKSNIDPAEKLRIANEQLGKSFETVKEQQNDAGGILNRLQNTLGDLFEKIGTQLLDAIAPLAQSLLPILEQSIGFIGQILEPLKPVLEQVIAAVVKIVNSLSGPAMGLLMAILEPLINMFLQLLPVILQIVDIALPPLVQIINILANAFRELMPAFQPIINMIIMLLPPVGQLAGALLNALVPIIKVLVNVALTLVKALFQNEVVMGTLYNVIKIVSGVLQFLTTILNGVAYVANIVGTSISVVVEKIGNLITAISSFDIGKIKAAISDFGNVGSDIQNKLAAGAAASKEAAAQTAELNTQQKELNLNLKNQPPPTKTKEAGDAANKAAEELKKAKEALADLTAEQKKQREINSAESLQSTADREAKKLQIETDFQVASLEKERKALESSGELRSTQEAIINKKIEMLREESARKLAAIETKAKQDQIKSEEDQQKKLEEVSTKFIQRRLDKLKAELSAGNTAIASDLIATQRKVIEGGLQSSINAIIEQTPEYQKGIEELNRQLAAGLSVAEFRSKADELRKGILTSLQGQTGDTKNIFALQIRDQYEAAADEIAKGTADIVAQIRQQQVKQAGDIFADSLRGIGEALRSVDFATIYGNAAEQAAELNKEQEALLENLKAGETTYQDAVDELRNLGDSQEKNVSAFAQAISASFQAIADQQAKAAEDGINKVNEILERRRQITLQEVELEKAKASEIKALQDQGIKDKEVYEQALADIEKRYTQEKTNLKKEDEKIAQEAAQVQEAALNQIAVSAGAAFASLVAGGENAGEALKKVVGSTVSSLLDLYTPSILALFSSIIPPPFGTLAGLAAVQALKVLLQQALSGFEEGGFTGNGGTKEVAGVVHGQEFVMNAQVTKRNRALLEHLHAGKSVESFPALQKMLAENQISTIPVTELQMMRSELSAIRQRLDSMPNGIQGEMGVNVELGMDTYLYERDRHRMHVRRLRG